MKKMNSLLVFASVFFFLFLVVEGVQAQSSTLAGGAQEMSEFKVDISNLVSESDATNLLSAAYKDAGANMANVVNAIPSVEATAGIRLEYYDYLLEELGTGASLETILPESISELNKLRDRYGASVNIDLAAIYTDAVSLLQQ